MKRKLALLILVIMAVSVLLVACNDTEKTTTAQRWDDEVHVFHISLADFANSTYSAFAKYNADGKVAANGDYRKDKALTGETAYSTRDEVVPVAVYGTYTLTISVGSDTCQVTGEQELYAQYKKSDVEGWDDLTVLLGKLENYRDEVAQTGLIEDDDNVVLRSETLTTVTFEIPSQKPVSSSTKVDGFYIGKVNREISQYEVSTEYSFKDEKKPTAKVSIDGKKAQKYELPSVSSTVDVIDSNQILIYLRSLNKTKTSLQDGKSAKVFNPFTGETQTASFAFSAYEDKMILTDRALESGKTVAATLSSVSVGIDGVAFMLQDNLPGNLKFDDKALDVYTTSNGEIPKYTTVHFRVGYLSFEIEYSNESNTAEWSKIWQVFTPKQEGEAD